MLQRLLLVFLLVASSLPGWAQFQQCRDLVFTTQQQVDDFAAIGCSGIDGNLTIYGSNGNGTGGITNLAPLSTITFVTGNLGLILDRMPNTQGLGNIKSIGGTLTITGALVLAGIDQNTFSSLESIGSGLVISDNTSLTNISGFPKLRSCNYIEIVRNSGLGAITGLNAVNSLVSLSINKCGSLRSVSGFNGLVTGAQLFIVYNKSLAQITGFTALTAANGLIINNNGALTELSGFNALNSLKEQLQIHSDSSLTSISGFNDTLVVNGAVTIDRNPVLRSITGFTGLKAVSLGISNNKSLPDVKGFTSSRLTNVSLSFNDNLKSLSGFALAEVTESINLNYNAMLDSIGTFKAGAAPAYIGVENNASLKSLAGGFIYSNYSTLSTLRLFNNPVLAACTEFWVCQYLRRAGRSFISGNAPSCTEAAILANCQTLATQQPVALAPAYPNPVRDVLYLSSKTHFRLRDLMGRVLLQGEASQVSMAALPTGVYVLETGRETTKSVRIIKQ
ncbi:T9SS type A sorting domain-containing protein [Hymenobacter lucidus]|uniref:T9SS type A sorting domain-containing protein n=1 Tax=Hymenobacter lucidus TaxID=2880930 RepID=A0ABS8AXI8_9BACT|nr:T9SS type A sorting domain-containing protein [Hymenobacter lucidus]MCB2410488.1 T9SS type A sorting domain-containing protein [Hymenobacter lucidus]